MTCLSRPWRAAASAAIALTSAVATPHGARAEIFGLKGLNQAEGGPRPVVLYGFQEDGSASRFTGEARVGSEPIAADGLALSGVHGLVAFELVESGSRLVRLDPATAEAARIGPVLTAREIRGATFDGPDRLLALDVAEPALLTVDPTTGAVLDTVTVQAPVTVESDIATDGRGKLYLVTFDRTLFASRVYMLDAVTGAAVDVYQEGDILPGERHPLNLGGLAFSEESGPDTAFGFDVHDNDDVLRYRLPFSASRREKLYTDVHPEWNAGHVDLAGYIVPLPEPSPTPSATPSSTATRTPTATSTASATATSPPPCVPVTQSSDIVLVLDRSSSMGDQDKILGAKLALRTFVQSAAAPPDQIALVTFAEAAGVNQPLTTDKGAVLDALQTVILGAGTRIDRGLIRAREELASPRHTPGRSAVIVLLTDGLQSGAAAAAARAEAAGAKADGAIIFTIGLGDDVDSALLTDLATSASHFQHAPTASELEEIYRQISVRIPCPTGTPPLPPTPSPTQTESATTPATPTGSPTGPTTPPPTGSPITPTSPTPAVSPSVTPTHHGPPVARIYLPVLSQRGP